MDETPSGVFDITLNIMNYEKLMAQNPFKLGVVMNEKGQRIDFYEHPIWGDEAPIICVSHDLKLAANSTFFDTEDMTSEYDDYRPWFDIDGKLQIGF